MRYYGKERAQRIHSIRRAKERYNLDLTDDDLELIVAMIIEGKTKGFYKQSNSRVHHLLTYKDVECVVVYDRKRMSIATFLPYEARHI